MHILSFLIILCTPNQNINTMIITENIKHIVLCLEEEKGLYHKNIGLLSNWNDEEMEPVLACLKMEMPGVSIKHIKSNTMKKNLCFPSEHDLIIQTPEGILQARQGRFTYSFQSRLKNVFGTYEIELKPEGDRIDKGQEQFFITSIGG